MKPDLHVGFRVPFDKLDPAAFQGFITQVMSVIGRSHGWEAFQESEVGPDGGFDAWTPPSSGGCVCLQAKRHKKVDLTCAARELAKVAVRSASKGARPHHHLLICSGVLTLDLQDAMREDQQPRLRAEAIRIAVESSTAKENPAPRRRRTSMPPSTDTGNSIEVVTKLLAEMDIEIWGGQEFDNRLTQHWSELLTGAIARYFEVARVVEEYARPDFDLHSHISKVRAASPSQWIELLVEPLPAMTWLQHESQTDPLSRGRQSGGRRPIVGDTQPFPILTALSELPEGPSQFVLLTGPGGSGKTQALRALARHLVDDHRRRGLELPIPIFVSLGAYRGCLDTLVLSELELNYGCWQAIPGEKWLLIDGFDNLSHAAAQQVMHEIATIGNRRNIQTRVILTSRPNGPRTPISSSVWWRILSMLPFTQNHVYDLASSNLTATQRTAFMNEWVRLRMNRESYALPLLVAAAIRVWQDDERLPPSRYGLLARLETMTRMGVESPRKTGLTDKLARVPYTTIRMLAAAISWRAWYLDDQVILDHDRAILAIRDAMATQSEAARVTLESVTPLEARELMEHYEFLLRRSASDAPTYSLPHEVMLATLVTDSLLRNWRELPLPLPNDNQADAWTLAASQLPEIERDPFLRKLASASLAWAAMAAVEMSSADLIVDEIRSKIAEASDAATIRELTLALSLIGTESCKAMLREVSYSRDDRWRWPARVALARCGDTELLRGILPIVDRNENGPAKHSGGEMELWRVAPPLSKLSTARERLKNNWDKGPLDASFQVISTWGDDSDLDLLVHALREGEHNIVTRLRGFHWLLERRRATTIELLNETISSSSSIDVRGPAFKFAQSLGLVIDQRWALGQLIAPPPDLADSSPMFRDLDVARWAHEVGQIAQILHDEETLLDEVRDAVSDDIAVTPFQAVQLLWIGLHHSVSTSVDTARRVLLCGDLDNYMFDVSCRYFTSQPPDIEIADFIVLQSEDWPIERIASGPGPSLVNLLRGWGRLTSAARLVARYVAQLGSGSESSQDDFRSWEPFLLDEVHILSCSERNEFLCLNWTGWSGPSIALLRKLTASLDNREADEILALTQGRVRERLLQVLSERGPTARRCEMLRSLLIESSRHLVSAELRECACALWSSDMLTLIIELLVAPPRSRNAREDLIAVVEENITGEQVGAHVEPLVAMEQRGLDAWRAEVYFKYPKLFDHLSWNAEWRRDFLDALAVIKAAGLSSRRTSLR